MEYSSDYADPYFNRGYAFLETGRNELALADLRKCLTINPDHQGTKAILEKLYKN
ncbi:MAG: tetratricopeptide repeat protein [Melioribacteraceae bacterium]|nr:tetratricopeptide repeat protein [Melioribacteraceae bacterium]